MKSLKIEILHSCLNKGISLRVVLNKPLTLSMFPVELMTTKFNLENDFGGFYRLTLCGYISISGIPKRDNLVIDFPFFRRGAAFEVLKDIFEGIESLYESKLKERLV